MLTRMQVDHEIDQGAFQLRARAGETNKTAPAEFCRPIKIQEIQSCAERDVIERLGQSWFVAPSAHDTICARVFANRNALVRQIRSFQKQVALRFVERARALRKIGNLLADLAHFRFKFVARFATRLFPADLLTQTIALRL